MVTRSKKRIPRLADISDLRGDDVLVADLLAVANGDAFNINGSTTLDVTLAERFRELVTKASVDLFKLADEFFRIAVDILSSIKTQRVVRRGKHGFKLGYEDRIESPEAALNLGLMLLLDVEKPYGKALCRCRRSSCQRFYLAKKNPAGGPANRNYCSPAHRAEAHDLKENRPKRKSK